MHISPTIRTVEICGRCSLRQEDHLHRHFDLNFDALRRHVRGEIEGRDGLLETKPIRNEWFDVDLAGAHEGERTWEDMCIAKDVFDPRLLHLGTDDAEGDEFGRHADEDHAAARAKRIEDTLESADIA